MYTWNTKGLIRSSISVVQWVSYYQRSTFTLKLNTCENPKYQHFGTDAESSFGNLTTRGVWGLMFKFLRQNFVSLLKLISPEHYLYWANHNHASNNDSLLRLFTLSGHTVLRHTIIQLVAVLSCRHELWITFAVICANEIMFTEAGRERPLTVQTMSVTLVSWDDPSVG